MGNAFLASAQALSDVAGDDEHYGNAIALLVVHAAIAWADAISIAFAEQRSTAGDHLQAVQVLRGALGTKLPDAQEKRLRRIISAKDEISYQGTCYPLREGRALLDRAQLFVTWGRTLYESRRVRVK